MDLLLLMRPTYKVRVSSYLWDPHIKWGEFLNINLLLLVGEIKNNKEMCMCVIYMCFNMWATLYLE